MHIKLKNTLILIIILSTIKIWAQTLTIDMSNQTDVNDKLYGFHTAGLFQSCNCGTDISSEYCAQQIKALHPQVLRFPTGGESKFTNLMDGPGYGFNATEIQEFFTARGIVDTPDPNDTWSEWLDPINGEVAKQTANFDGIASYRYIDRFLNLVKYLEDTNGDGTSDYTIDVIFVFNLLTETPARNMQALNYLLSNPTHNINVVGVEMGNECYAWDDVLDYSNPDLAFNQYYNLVKPNSKKLRQQHPEIAIAVAGAPAYNLTYLGSYVYPSDKRTLYANWNSDIYSHMSSTISIGGSSTALVFDDIVAHVYVDDKFFEYTNEKFSDYYLDTLAMEDPDLAVTFDVADTRLTTPFSSFISETYAYLWGASIHEGIYGIIRYYRDVFQLSTTYSDRSLWLTEWNLSANDYANTFSHAVLLFQLLFKYNYYNHYFTSSDQIIKYSTMHNLVGQYGKALISPKDDKYDETDPLDPDLNADFRKRTPYYSFFLSNYVFNLNLKSVYAPPLPGSNYSAAFVNNSMIYYYYIADYPNSGGDVNINNINLDFNGSPDCYLLGTPVINEYIDAKQLYSTAGDAEIYRVNEFYDILQPEFELKKLTDDTFPTIGNVNIKEYSIGVIKIPYSKFSCDELKSGDISDLNVNISPNPFTSNAVLSFDNSTSETYTLQIRNMAGKIMQQYDATNGNSFQIYRKDLASGIYLFHLQSNTLTKDGKFIIQ